MGPKRKAGAKPAATSTTDAKAGTKTSAQPSAKKGTATAQSQASQGSSAPSKNDSEKKGKGKGKDKLAAAPEDAPEAEKKPKTVKQIIGGDSWTGKLPQTLLNEAAQKRKWQNPIYNMRQIRGGGGYISTVVLRYENAKKEIEEVTFVPPTENIPDGLPTACETSLEARHYAATYALHRISEGRNLSLVLPKTYRDYWAIFEDERKRNLDRGWMYSSNPFQVQRERKAAEAEKQALREKQKELSSSVGKMNIGHSGKWSGMPTVELSRSARLAVETLIKDWHIWNPDCVKIVSGDRKRIVDKLSSVGFRKSHVEEACDWTKDEEEALEWLLIHVPEDDLPSNFLPENYSGGSITFAVDPLSLDYKIRRMCLAGYSTDVVRDALLRFGENEHRASEYLFHSLLGRQEDLISFEDDLISFDDSPSTPVEQTWDEEVQVIESILGGSKIEKVDSKTIKIALEAGGENLPKKLTLQIQKPLSKEYPQEIPTFTLLSEPILPSFLRLCITKKTGEYASEFKGQGGMIYSTVDWLQDNLKHIIATPGKLRDVQKGVTGISSAKNPSPRVSNASEKLEDTQDSSRWKRSVGELGNILFKQREERLETPEQKSMIRFREKLPAWKSREEIVKGVNEAQVVIISGETGSGKSTQAVQFVLDHEISSKPFEGVNIVCTQPRRISAIGLAERVSQERCSTVGDEVGYAIRGQTKVGKNTQITFMTTGVLLRRLRSGLKDVTHIFVDEVHERSVETDYLLILLKRMLEQKQKVKVILMSATLDSDLFATYFADWDVRKIVIEGRTYPVQDFYLDDVLSLTEYEYTKGRGKYVDDETRGMDPSIGATIRALGDKLNYKLLSRLVEYIDSIELRGQDGSILIFLSGTMEISKALKEIGDLPKSQSYVVLPLHASLIPSDQAKVFERHHGKRKIICATNVAETSITINDVVAVIDTGRVKETSLDPQSGIVRLAETWASNAQCKQRRGRAGRVRSGKCFKLYTRNTESTRMAANSIPEMLRIPLENLVLNIKAMGIHDVKKFLKSALSPPNDAAVIEAENMLSNIGALDAELKLTGLGHHLSLIPSDLRCAKLMVLSSGVGILSAGVAIASIITSRSPFLSSPDKREESKASRVFFGRGNGDLVADYRAYQEWSLMRRAKIPSRDVHAWCDENNLSRITLNDIASNESYFISALKEIGFVPPGYDHEKSSTGEYKTLNSQGTDDSFLRAVVAAAFQPQIARIAMPDKKYAATLSGAKELDPEARTIKFFSQAGRVFLHPSSTLFDAQSFVNNASFLAFTSQVVTSKPFVHDVTPINTLTLLLFGGKLMVDISGNGLRVNEWIKVRGWARIGVLVRILRSMLDDALQKKFTDPTINLESLDIMACIKTLIQYDGKVQ